MKTQRILVSKFPFTGASRVTLALVVLAMCDAGSVLAQQVRDARVVLTAGGPTGAVRSMAFSANSRQLYIAGADKSVEIWSLPEVLGSAPDLKLVSHARWPISRHDRGQIWALAVNDARSMIAFGGYGANQSSGDISIAESVHGRQLTILPPPQLNESLSGKERLNGSHMLPIHAVSFSPNGELLTSMSEDGDLRLWAVADWSSNQLLGPLRDSILSSVRVQFISNTQLVAARNVSAGSRGETKPQLTMFTITPDRKFTSQLLDSPHEKQITALGCDPSSGRWYSGDQLGQIATWRGSQRQGIETQTPLRPIPVRAISVSTTGLLLTLHSPIAAEADSNKADRKSYVELNRATDAGLNLVERREWGLNGQAFAAAISRDGKYAAFSRPGEAAVEVFALVDKNNQPRLQPFAAQRPTVLAGSGATVQRVQFAKQPSTLLAISTNQDGAGWTHGFNLATAQVVRPNALGPVQPAHTAADWSVATGDSDEGKPQAVTIRSNGVPRATITLEHTRHGHYAAHCWIFENGKAAPSAVAIGTERQNGIFMYDLRQPGQAPLLRYYRDHTNTVTSLSQSADGRYLASSSRDQTVRIWSLEDLFSRPGVFPKRAAWGGEFEIRDGQLIVTSVMEFGVLKGKNIQNGDKIIKIAFADSKQNGTRKEETEPRAMLKALQDLPLTEAAEVHASRPTGNLPPFIITPGWEPMTTLFIDRRNEWAAWTPAGYYHASVDGDELFGFQINPATRGGDPQFSRAEQLRQDYERPDLMQKLFAIGSFTGAAKAVAIVPKNAGAVVAQMPRVRMTAPASMASFPSGAAVTITSEVNYHSLPPGGFRVDAWVNGAKLGAPVLSVVGTSTRYSWTITRPAGVYQALVKVESLGAVPSRGLYSDATVPFVVSGLSELPTIHVLAVGANNYRNAPLKYCINDVRELVQLFRTNAGPLYRLGVVKVLADDATTEARKFQKNAFVAELGDFATQIKQANTQPKDIVMVFINGHGAAIGNEFYFVPPVAEITDLAREANVAKHSIPWSAFRSFVEELPSCNKVFFMDTCFSGNIATLESDKARLRPLKNLNTVVFASTSEDQKAYEDDNNKHGRFTFVLLEGLGGRADGTTVNPELAGQPPVERDGRVSLLETIGYVSQKVTYKTHSQQPTYTPMSLLRFFNEPIIEFQQPAQIPSGK